MIVDYKPKSCCNLLFQECVLLCVSDLLPLREKWWRWRSLSATHVVYSNDSRTYRSFFSEEGNRGISNTNSNFNFTLASCLCSSRPTWGTVSLRQATDYIWREVSSDRKCRVFSMVYFWMDITLSLRVIVLLTLVENSFCEKHVLSFCTFYFNLLLQILSFASTVLCKHDVHYVWDYLHSKQSCSVQGQMACVHVVQMYIWEV
jgi:hypothetical protein